MRVVMLVLNDMTADARVDREASALAECGHEVSVIALRSRGLPDHSERPEGFRVHRVADLTTAGWTSPLRKVNESRTRHRLMVAAAAALRPDVIHAHDADTFALAEDVALALRSLSKAFSSRSALRV